MASSEGYAVIWTLLQEHGWCLSLFKPHSWCSVILFRALKLEEVHFWCSDECPEDWWLFSRLSLLLLHSEASILRGRMWLIRRSVPKTSVYLMYMCLWAEWECQRVAWSEGKIRGPLDKHVSIDTIHYRKGRSEILLARCGVWLLH